jgi:2-polyprenyl-6-hydroxyphenyl methylase/3-demethylubiquinone-9 3-methyltransferase
MNLEDLETHFRFGDNWQSYAHTITEGRIERAVAGLRELVPDDCAGKTFLDIGCGSGIHSLAASILGAKVTPIDIDPASVDATHSVLNSHGFPAVVAKQVSVFDLNPATFGQFDIVYSWGVLHHTGDMWRAVSKAADLVRPGGRLVLALYDKTPFCGLWRAEKVWYSKASEMSQRRARAIYVMLFRLKCALTGRSFAKRVAGYDSYRGMDYYHDLHDWMGGYPYESTRSSEVKRFLESRGFSQTVFIPSGVRMGMFGSGCSQYAFVRDA